MAYKRSAPYHTELMQHAIPKLREILSRCSFRDPPNEAGDSTSSIEPIILDPMSTHPVSSLAVARERSDRVDWIVCFCPPASAHASITMAQDIITVISYPSNPSTARLFFPHCRPGRKRPRNHVERRTQTERRGM